MKLTLADGEPSPEYKGVMENLYSGTPYDQTMRPGKDDLFWADWYLEKYKKNFPGKKDVYPQLEDDKGSPTVGSRKVSADAVDPKIRILNVYPIVDDKYRVVYEEDGEARQRVMSSDQIDNTVGEIAKIIQDVREGTDGIVISNFRTSSKDGYFYWFLEDGRENSMWMPKEPVEGKTVPEIEKAIRERLIRIRKEIAAREAADTDVEASLKTASKDFTIIDMKPVEDDPDSIEITYMVGNEERVRRLPRSDVEGLTAKETESLLTQRFLVAKHEFKFDSIKELFPYESETVVEKIMEFTNAKLRDFKSSPEIEQVRVSSYAVTNYLKTVMEEKGTLGDPEDIFKVQFAHKAGQIILEEIGTDGIVEHLPVSPAVDCSANKGPQCSHAGGLGRGGRSRPYRPQDQNHQGNGKNYCPQGDDLLP